MSEHTFNLEQMSSLSELECGIVTELAQDGVVEVYEDPTGNAWFGESALRKILLYRRIRSEIGANHEGAEFAVLLLSDLDELRHQKTVQRPQHQALRVDSEPQED